MDHSELIRRATAAYFRAPLDGGVRGQPSPGEVMEHEGLAYVRLSNINGTLAVYRVRIVNGKPALKGLKRWPKALD